jgi:hypothetical protein
VDNEGQARSGNPPSRVCCRTARLGAQARFANPAGILLGRERVTAATLHTTPILFPVQSTKRWHGLCVLAAAAQYQSHRLVGMAAVVAQALGNGVVACMMQQADDQVSHYGHNGGAVFCVDGAAIFT